MHRRVPAQELRGSDSTLLEVQLPNLLRRPLGQLAPENALDLLALAESEDRPKAVARQLEQFVERAHREVQDMPGSQLADWLAELSEIDASLVPTSLRDWLTAEIGRDDRDDGLLEGILSRWEPVEPKPFTIGERKAKVQRAAAGGAPRGSASRTASRPRGSTGSGTGRAKRSGPPRISGRAADPAKDEVIRRICMERLNGATEKGLAETVLVAGVRHRAKADGYSSVTPAEVTAVLRGLKAQDRVRYSAGRWMSTARRW